MTPVHHSVEHYENFPVASWLMPARLRPAVVAIYRFARHADDLADEGDLPAQTRLAELARLTEQIQRARDSDPVSDPFVADLIAHVRAHDLPWSCFEDLLSAFAQDVCVQRYASEAQVMDYCARSANPVGRLMLALTETREAVAQMESDAICSALQRINFLQDLAIDWPRGRLYLNQQTLATHGVAEQDIGEACRKGYSGPALRACLADEALRCRHLLAAGRALPARVGGRFGLELRAIMSGGERILDQLAARSFDSVLRRPRLRAIDTPALIWGMMRGVRFRLPDLPVPARVPNA